MANYLLSSFLTVVDELLNEATVEELAEAGRYRQIRAAVSMYSRDKPEVFSEDISGDGGKYYALVGDSPVTSRWVDEFSRTVALEYPAAAVTSDESPTYLDADDFNDNYRVEVSGTQTRYLYFKTAAPASTESFRITYTTPYRWTVSSVTTDVSQTAHGFSVDDYIYHNGTSWVIARNTNIATHQVTTVTDADNFTCAILQTTTPSADFTAICYKAACLICRAVAAKYSRIGDSLVGVDSAASTTKAQEFSRRAREFCDAYAEMLGISAGDSAKRDKPAGVFIDLDTTPPWRQGRRYLYH